MALSNMHTATITTHITCKLSLRWYPAGFSNLESTTIVYCIFQQQRMQISKAGQRPNLRCIRSYGNITSYRCKGCTLSGSKIEPRPELQYAISAGGMAVSQWFGTPLAKFCNLRTNFCSLIVRTLFGAFLLTLTPLPSVPGIIYHRCTHSKL